MLHYRLRWDMKETGSDSVDREGLSEKVTLNCDIQSEKDPDMQWCRIVKLVAGCGCTGEGEGSRVTLSSGLSH